MRSRYVLVLTIILLNPTLHTNAIAQTENNVILLEEGKDNRGPIFIEYNCKEISCEGMELIINNNQEVSNFSDIHRVTWSGWSDGQLSWKLVADESVDISQISENFIFNYNGTVEEEDLPNNIPLSNHDDSIESLEATSVCQLDKCSKKNNGVQGAIYTGALTSDDDKDSINIIGNNGDMIAIKNFVHSNEMNIEIWNSNGEIKTLIEDLSSNIDEEYYFEYPEGDLWLRIVPSVEMEYSPYQFQIIRYDSSKESPDSTELANPWIHGTALPFGEEFLGHIVSSDYEGDSLLVRIGSKMDLKLICKFSNEVNIEIFFHQTGGNETQYIESVNHCPDEIHTNDLAQAIEFRITSNFSVSWEIGLVADVIGDGGNLGDAPDYIWQHGLIDDNWLKINNNGYEYTGMLDNDDEIDIFAIEVTEENGSHIYLNQSQGEVNIQIIILNQENGMIINYTNGSEIIAPKGIHALRIEKKNGESGAIEYSFLSPEFKIYEQDNTQLEDLSSMFTNFYIFVGIMFLSPMMLVIWWNKENLRGNKKLIFIEQHEVKRLANLRAKISKDIDKDVIISSLHQLGDSPWESVIQEWGDPQLKHFTEQVEVCIWKINEDGTNLLLGLNTSNKIWNMAAIRIFASEGPAVTISEITPEQIFDGDEIFLGTLEKRNSIFLKVAIANGPLNIDFQLSGLVGGKPMAASSRLAINWTEEE
ncbi:MAG: hypothetical protein ACKVI6_03230 [Candidatus Poseidoniales archaeon]